MSNLSPAAIALEADLYLLTRLPLPKDANLDAIKERVFGSMEGPPRTEDESKRRYVDAIVEAFDVVGVYHISDFPKEVKNLLHKYNLANIKHSQVSAQLKAAQGTLDDMHEHRDFVLARRRANDLELEVNQLRTENANLKDDAHALTAERDRLDARVREHEETLSVLGNLNAELFKTQQELREARDEVKRQRDQNESLEERLQNLRDHVRELQAEMAEQENSYNLLALVVVDLLKGRGVE